MSTGKDYDECLRQISFYGGLSDDRKLGTKNSFANAECMDVRKEPSAMSVLPMATETELPEAAGLPVAMAKCPNNALYALTDIGKVYEVSNTIVPVSNHSQSATSHYNDILYSTTDDQLVWTGANSIYGIRNVTNGGTEVFNLSSNGGILDVGATVARVLEVDAAGVYFGGKTQRDATATITGGYNVPTALTESDNDKFLFIPTISPTTSVHFQFKTAVSSTVTVRLEDEQNNTIASSVQTIAAGSNKWVTFTFQKEVDLRVYSINTTSPYHFHITSNTAGNILNTVGGGTTFSYARVKLFTSALFDFKYHPMVAFQNYIAIGNKGYLATYQATGLTTEDSGAPLLESGTINPTALRLPTGYCINGLALNDEYIIMSAYKESDDGVNLQDGALFFWDGYTDGFNFMITSPMGVPEAIFTYANITYCVIEGALYAYTGTKELIKVRSLTDIAGEFTGVDEISHVYPHAATVRRNIMEIAYPGETTLTNQRFGIYAWGSNDKNYPNCLTYNYKLSHDIENYNSDDQTLRLGCSYNFGDTLYYAWSKNGVNYLSKINNSSVPAKTFKFESLAFDDATPGKDKLALRFAVSYRTLPEGAKIRLKYRIDEGEWVYDTKESKDNSDITIMEINKRFRDIQVGFDGTITDGSIPPRFFSVDLDFRELKEERRIA